jgi:hypothetical protein
MPFTNPGEGCTILSFQARLEQLWICPELHAGCWAQGLVWLDREHNFAAGSAKLGRRGADQRRETRDGFQAITETRGSDVLILFAYTGRVSVGFTEQERKRLLTRERYVVTVAISASIIAAIRLPRPGKLDLNMSTVTAVVQQSVRLASTILDEVLRTV